MDQPELKFDSRLTEAQLQLVTAYVQERLAHPLRVRDLAEAVGMSASCFARLFHQTTGVTPHTFILSERVRRAQELIGHPAGLTLAQIAIRCGFADQAHLTRVFRRIAKVTPAAYCRSQGVAPR